MKGTVLITGASRGIGRSTALAFAKAGYRIAVNYNKSDESAASLMRELAGDGIMAFAYKCDVSNSVEVEHMVEQTTRALGEITVLINNAGVALPGLITDVSPDDFNRVMRINVGGAFNCIKSVLPSMISRRHGVILNISSMWGLVGASCEVAYSTSKAALIGMTKALAKEVGPSCVRVNCVAPGVIDTDMNSNLTAEDMEQLCDDTPLMRIGTPDDIARALLFLASDDASFITGQVLSVNGGFVI